MSRCRVYVILATTFFCDSPKCNSKVVLRKVCRLSTNRLMEHDVVSRDRFSASHIEIVELVYEALSFNY